MKQLNRINLDGEFYVTPEDWIEETPMFQLGGDQSALPETPGVNPAAFDTAVMNQGADGLTPTETALLSEEEKGIRLRQRGMTT